MKSWNDIGFAIEITGDGSPSLRLLQSADPLKFKGESMHHSGGACAETLLIYGEPFRQVLQHTLRPQILVVGLGLGYIELTLAREALLLGKSADDIGLITSFESVPDLRHFFFLWLHDLTKDLHEEVVSTYDLVCSYVVKDTPLAASELKQFLRRHFRQLSDLSEALSPPLTLSSRYHCVLYDAFSSKTTPFLWEQDFLEKFLDLTAADSCTFSTYACRGALKKALQNKGFQVIVREGFQGKRNSTLGLKTATSVLNGKLIDVLND